MSWLLGKLEEENKGRIILIYRIEPPQNVIDSYDFCIESDVEYPSEKPGKQAVAYINPETEEIWYEYIDRELTPEERTFKSLEVVAQISTRGLIHEDKLSPEEIILLQQFYPRYEVGVEYKVGDLIVYNNVMYEVIQAHTSQEDWKPDEVPALYLRKLPDEVIPEWIQPIGAHDAYMMGDLVTHNGLVWESEVDNNTWEPGVYGWVEVE